MHNYSHLDQVLYVIKGMGRLNRVHAALESEIEEEEEKVLKVHSIALKFKELFRSLGQEAGCI